MWSVPFREVIHKAAMRNTKETGGNLVGYSEAPSSICLLSSIGTIDTSTLDQQTVNKDKFNSSYKDIS